MLNQTMSAEVLHPTLERLTSIRDALFLGLGHDLMREGLLGGELAITYVLDEDPNYQIEYLVANDLRSGEQTAVAFPRLDAPNPMAVTEFDDESFVCTTAPVLARVIMNRIDGESYLLMGRRYTQEQLSLITAQKVIFNYTEQTSIVSAEESAQMQPVVAQFDGDTYRWADSKVNTPTMQVLLDAAIEYL
jgi:hypothetical protein